MSIPPVSLHTILSESNRIIKEHSLHFKVLGVLFLVPISYSISLYPILKPQLLLLDQKSLILALSYTAFVFVLSLCATSSITYSVFKGFYGRPVKFVSAIKSIFNSFLPLFVTTSLCHIILSGVLVIFAVFLFSVVKFAEVVGFDQYEYSSPYFICFGLVILIVYLFVLVYLGVKWSLVPVIVVVESSWGVKALKRSASLINEYKSTGLSLYLYFLMMTAQLVWISSLGSTTLFGMDFDDKWDLALVFLSLTTTHLLIIWVFLACVAANTVLYIHCKAVVNGEIISEDFFAKEYVSLPFDDGKVPLLKGY
ncbi:hypothetical protein Pint_23571 [Pistacia integerrima]|uniref:Uncharacterized protein n=1 Tax=Pistacia integerrima TaxID=434235 RepID=A0ACC0YK10_9ROSI|nr:hypothetical protein Pint_23571 [Pistacia integerrima]